MSVARKRTGLLCDQRWSLFKRVLVSGTSVWWGFPGICEGEETAASDGGWRFGLPWFRKCNPRKIRGGCGPVRKEHGPSDVRALTRSVDSAGQGPPLAGAICCYLPSWNYFHIESSRIFRESCRAQQPRTWALPLQAAWPWASYLDCQALRFFTCQMRIIMCTSQDYGEK